MGLEYMKQLSFLHVPENKVPLFNDKSVWLNLLVKLIKHRNKTNIPATERYKKKEIKKILQVLKTILIGLLFWLYKILKKRSPFIEIFWI